MTRPALTFAGITGNPPGTGTRRPGARGSEVATRSGTVPCSEKVPGVVEVKDGAFVEGVRDEKRGEDF